MKDLIHKPVLFKEVIRILDPKQEEFFVDGTIGGGGHAEEIFKKISPGGTLLGIDWDKDAIARCRTRFGNREDVILEVGNYANLPSILRMRELGKVDGLLLDLGFSSDQIEHSGRGFSFINSEPLIMTYSDDAMPVRDLLKQITEKDLADAINNYGEERFAQRIARAIKTAGRKNKIGTSKELAEIISSAVPAAYRHGRLHPATRTFQALRIYANQELENLKRILAELPHIMNRGGRVAIISFHSLEDRIVKHAFGQLDRDGVANIITKKPITASEREVSNNPRSRSAKLRALEFRT